MIVWTANKEPIPIQFDDGDPILPFVASGRLFYNASRGYVVWSKTTYRVAMCFVNIMMKVDHFGTVHVEHIDGDNTNMRRANLVIGRSGRSAPGAKYATGPKPTIPKFVIPRPPAPPRERNDASSLATMEEEGQWQSFTVTQRAGVPVLQHSAIGWRISDGSTHGPYKDTALAAVSFWNLEA